MIEVETHDGKYLKIGGNYRALVVGVSVVIQNEKEVFMITPIANITSLIKTEEEV